MLEKRNVIEEVRTPDFTKTAEAQPDPEGDAAKLFKPIPKETCNGTQV